MIVSRVLLRDLSRVGAFADLSEFQESEIVVLLSKWRLLEVNILNVLAPRGSAFFNFRAQKQLEDISLSLSERLLERFSADDIEADLRSMHLERGSAAAFLCTGELTQHFGDHFAAFPDQFELFTRRHFSVAIPDWQTSRAIDFLLEQERVFADTATVHCRDSESFLYTGIDISDAVQRILALGMDQLSVSDIEMCESGPIDVSHLPGVWNDPCPIRLIDDSYRRAPEVIRRRCEAVSSISTFPVLLHWKNRISQSDVYPGDLRIEIIERIAERMSPYESLVSWEV